MENELREQLKALKGEAETIQKKIAGIRQHLAELGTPFKVGDIVTQGKGTNYQVTAICPGYGETAEIHGAKIKKDGTPGAVSVQIFEWSDKDKIQLA